MSVFAGRARWRRGLNAFVNANASIGVGAQRAAAGAAAASAGASTARAYAQAFAQARANAFRRAASHPQESAFCRAFKPSPPGILDFSPTLKFTQYARGPYPAWAIARYRREVRRRQAYQHGYPIGGAANRTSPWSCGRYRFSSNHSNGGNAYSKRGRCGRTGPFPGGFPEQIRHQLLKSYLVPGPRRRKACSWHGTLKDKVFICGNGGGSWKADFLDKQWRKKQEESEELARLLNDKREEYRKQWYTARGEGRFADIAKQFLQEAEIEAQAEEQGRQPVYSAAPERSFKPFYFSQHGSKGFFRSPPPFTGISSCGLGPFGPLGFQFRSALPTVGRSPCRLFSSSAKRSGLPLLITKAGWLLKSSAALSYVNLLFRMSVTVLPISIKRAMWARKIRLERIASGLAGAGTRSWFDTLMTVLTKGALALPFVLLAAVLLASLERTPISGRWRMLLLSEKEEKDIVNKVLEVGVTSQLQSSERDWLSIMRAVLGEEEAAPGTLLGGRVLNAQTDWRVSLVEDILSKLESGIPHLAYPTPASSPLPSPSLRPIDLSKPIRPPPLSHTLTGTRCEHLDHRNAVIVIDRPESNAFSFGFYGSADQPQPGVIIVFTGAIDEILSARQVEEQTKIDEIEGVGLQLSLSHQSQQVETPTWLRYFFGSAMAGGRVTPASNSILSPEIASNTPYVSKEQEEALAVLVAHELAHLVLSHTIESYATTTLLWPQLEKFGWDMLRVFIYPITAILGPFVQDAISATVKVGASETSGLLPSLTSSCESRKMETEADLVGLRLLANAGIDPRRAVAFWEERLLNHEHKHDHEHERGHDHNHGKLHGHSSSTVHGKSEGHSFIRTHPADQERIQAIRMELQRWQKEGYSSSLRNSRSRLDS